MVKGYTAYADPDVTAKAIGKELPISPRSSREVCGMIRGKKVNDAVRMLEEVVALKRPVPLKRFKKRVSHKPGVGPGRYPKKAAGAILEVIQSAMANAEYKGLDSDEMVIATITASRGRVQRGFMPRAQGRATPWNQELVNIEVILEEVE